MTDIVLSKAALVAAADDLPRRYTQEQRRAYAAQVIQTYLSADPDRAARDAVVEAARELDRAYIALDALQARGQAVPILNAHMSRIQDTKRALRAAVDALPKEGE